MGVLILGEDTGVEKAGVRIESGGDCRDSRPGDSTAATHFLGCGVLEEKGGRVAREAKGVFLPGEGKVSNPGLGNIK